MVSGALGYYRYSSQVSSIVQHAASKDTSNVLCIGFSVVLFRLSKVSEIEPAHKRPDQPISHRWQTFIIVRRSFHCGRLHGMKHFSSWCITSRFVHRPCKANIPTTTEARSPALRVLRHQYCPIQNHYSLPGVSITTYHHC